MENYKEIADKFCELHYIVVMKNKAVKWQHFEEAARLRWIENKLLSDLNKHYTEWLKINHPQTEVKDPKDEEIERLTEAIKKMNEQIDLLQKEKYPTNWVNVLEDKNLSK